MALAQPDFEFLSVRMNRQTKRKLETAAKRNDRSVSAEVRLAVASWLGEAERGSTLPVDVSVKRAGA